MRTQLLPHNKAAYRKAKAALATSQRTCVVQPTGTGKSYVIAAVSEGYKRVLVLAPNYFVLGQVERVLPQIKGHTAEMMTYAGLNAAEKMRGDYDLIVLDEFHRAGSPEWGEAVNELLTLNRGAKVLGTTATPIRHLDAGRDMTQELFGGNVASQMTIGEAWAKGILPVPVYVTGVFNFDKTISDTTRNITSSKALTEDERRRRLEQLSKTMLDWQQSHGMVSILRKYISADTKRVLVFCDHIGGMRQMVRTVTEWFEQAGLPVAEHYTLHSGLPDKTQERRMHNFESDEQVRRGVKLMFSVNMLNEGVHIPHVEAVLMLRTTKSRIIYMQQIGRCLTAANSERKPVVLDMADNISNTSAIHGMRDDFLRWKEKNRRQHKGDRDAVSFEIHDHLQELREVVEQLSVEKRVTVPFRERIKMLRDYCEKYGCLPVKRHGEDFRNWVILRRLYGHTSELAEITKQYPRYDKQRALQRMADNIMAFCEKNGRAPSYYVDSLSERRLGQAWKDKKRYLLTIEGMQECYDKYAKKKNVLKNNVAALVDFCETNHRLPRRGQDGKFSKMWAYAYSVRHQHPDVESVLEQLRKKYSKRRSVTVEDGLAEWEEYAKANGGLPRTARGSKTARRWYRFRTANKSDPRVAALMEKYGNKE